jgi:phosphatidylserine decarboxylase
MFSPNTTSRHLSCPSATLQTHDGQLTPASELRRDAVGAATPTTAEKGWLKHFFPSADTVDRLFAREHMGNFVVDRQSGRKVFESMPLYVRVGMHLLFVSASQAMAYRAVEELLIAQSIKRVFSAVAASVS